MLALVVTLVALTSALVSSPTVATASIAPEALIGGSYRNPVIARDFPDPFVLNVSGTFFAYATNAYGPNIQITTSTDLRNWMLHGDALPNLPTWATAGRTWAPSIVKLGSRYVLFFTARHRTGNVPCIGAASGMSPYGPFTPVVDQPIVCQPSRGGSIDPSPFVDAYGRPWLLWKSEGIVMKEPTRIWSRPMTMDARGFIGTATELVRTDQPWEGPIVENPSMVFARGAHFLFYSGNRWQGSSYGIGYAVCDGPAGPCRKAAAPWTTSTGPVAGPGGQEFFRGPDGYLWMSYHAWSSDAVGYPAGVRSLRVDRVWFGGGNPQLLGPSTSLVQY